jgi:mono/diheme cytochrome c family protein
MSASAAPTGENTTPPVLVADLFSQFVAVCGGCHGPRVDPPGQGGFQIQRDSTFASLMTRDVLNHVTKAVCKTPPDPPNPADPYDPMPPCSSPNGGTFSRRNSDSDPVAQFAKLVDAWLTAGSPASFTPGGAGASTSGVDAGPVKSPFALTPQGGNAMTNIGNCVPERLSAEPSDDALDAMFAASKAQPSGSAAQRVGLPESLDQTDLISLDSAILAEHGVIAYAPGYPLWSDNAGKLRHVRVPRGTSIHFDTATQQFTIPPNTRFYKTFMKQVIDTDGSYRYHKIETRLIVSRPDVDNADGTATQTALFGSYRWNDDESKAVLVETPLNNGTPFADTYISYQVDEPLAADVLRSQPADPEETLLEYHAVRHYAIPSSQRCVQCHMGSPSHSFVLGFTPLQINRRPVGTGGTIEATGPDELTQLQRFIDAGIVTGISSLSEVLPLEQSEGARMPRPASGVITATGLPDNYELVAQGYMLGNCQHCHNPRGFPTVQNPVLKDILNFLPSAVGGGIFQFPLERYSPRIGRGLSGDTPIHYITPSLVDLPRQDPHGGNQNQDVFVQGAKAPLFSVAYGPWRSLIYRNVDAAFAYTDDLALYPHMPMNTPGYDPRAKQIFSDWMVSIPAVRKHPETIEYAYKLGAHVYPSDDTVLDVEPQPYVEVQPGDPAYPGAMVAAQQRLDILHSGKNPAIQLDPNGKVYSRYNDLGVTDDIEDPAVRQDPICHPIPVGDATPPNPPYPFPRHPHWVVTDLTLISGDWAPKRADWANVLVKNMVSKSQGCTGAAGADEAYADQIRAVAALQTAKLSDVEHYATTPVPVGLWEQHPECDFSSVKKVSDFGGATAPRPHWMDVANPPPDAPVYQETPGAAVYKMICINCHGPQADSRGRMADNLATMSGGLAVPANFHAGLFGSRPSDGKRNVDLQFGVPSNASWPASWTVGLTDDDRAARYMPWMALGGTEVQIPQPILEIVAITSVLGVHRVLNASQLSANMLSQAKSLCITLLGSTNYDYHNNGYFDARDGHGYLDAKATFLNESLIASNYDAELWLRLCNQSNPSPIHILRPDPFHPANLQLKVAAVYGDDFSLQMDLTSQVAPSLPDGSLVYPADQQIGNERGGIQLPSAGPNLWPWCVDVSGSSTSDQQKTWVSSSGFPLCPTAVVAVAHNCQQYNFPPYTYPPGSCFGNEEASAWAIHGAINAGMSVYEYVKSIESTGPVADFNDCEHIK